MAMAVPRWISIQIKYNGWFYFTLFAWTALILFKAFSAELWPPAAVIAIATTLIAYGALLITLVWQDGAEQWRDALEDRPARFNLLIGFNMAMTLFYQLMVGDMTAGSILGGVAYWLLPALLLREAQKNKEHCGIYDILLLLSLWAPIHSGLIGAVYRFPSQELVQLIAAPAATVTLAIATIGVRQFEDVGLTIRHSLNAAAWRSTAQALILGCGAILGYLTLAQVPLAFTGKLESLPVNFAVVFVAVALPSELLFRGLILNILEKTSGSTWLAVACSALIYGVAQMAAPDILLMGAWLIAGAVCGLTYLRTASVVQSALVNAVIFVMIEGLT